MWWLPTESAMVLAEGVLKGGPSGPPEFAQRGRGQQHETEQLRSADAKALISEVQAADRVVLAQLLHRNPTHLARRRAGHCCEQQLARRLTRVRAERSRPAA